MSSDKTLMELWEILYKDLCDLKTELERIQAQDAKDKEMLKALQDDLK